MPPPTRTPCIRKYTPEWLCTESGGTHQVGCVWFALIGRCPCQSSLACRLSPSSEPCTFLKSKIQNPCNLPHPFPFSSPVHLSARDQFFNLTPASSLLTLLHSPDLADPFLSSSSPCPPLTPRLTTPTVPHAWPSIACRINLLSHSTGKIPTLGSAFSAGE